MNRRPLPLILTPAAIIFVAIWGGGFGAIFILLDKTEFKAWGVMNPAIIIGMGLIVGVPLMASLLIMFRGIAMNRRPLPLILTPAAILFVAIWGGGFGVIFILLEKTEFSAWGVMNPAIIIGMGLIVGVPLMASLLTLSKR